MSDQLLAEAHQFLDWAREQGADLDGTDESVWFVQGVLESMAEDTGEEPSLRVVKCLAYSVYLAELLADTCHDVRRVIDGEGMNLRTVFAIHAGGSTQFPLSWVRSCINDPQADNIAFKFAGALRDFGEEERAADMYAQAKTYSEYSTS
ncbi:hypothetical protein GCM10011579_033590 [Streptomyces albiflavescens]|uniref:Uncharacterized protein n=1 Tax=Streptomyces albiflavescens TaxID=1623582 RepID=A0A917Y2N3_9ACTN|nr:hypothetical protein [Streptomyces albiflavescens]GGN64312.1 hypothetical protein GCM10011579_033590 [Streptomyces albiflavescens]